MYACMHGHFDAAITCTCALACDDRALAYIYIYIYIYICLCVHACVHPFRTQSETHHDEIYSLDVTLHTAFAQPSSQQVWRPDDTPAERHSRFHHSHSTKPARQRQDHAELPRYSCGQPQVHIFIAFHTAASDGSDAAAALFAPGLTGQLHGIIIAKWTSHTREGNETTI